MQNVNVPAISIIIPMYNAEKTVAPLLESLLAQTFQDFEVVIADDCPTDNSREVVKSYFPKFGGRLKLIQAEKNSGGPSVPRNRGLFASRGKYVFFMDSDDLLVPNALETFFNFAEEYNADVVYTDRSFVFDDNPADAKILPYQLPQTLVDKPTLDTKDLRERIGKICRRELGVTPWQKFVKRDLMTENDIFFPDHYSEDLIWTINLYLHAENFLRIPNLLYLQRTGSITREDGDKLHGYKSGYVDLVERIVRCLDSVNALADNMEFFRENPTCRFALMDYLVHFHLTFLSKNDIRSNLPLLYKECKKNFSGTAGNYAGEFVYYFTAVAGEWYANLIHSRQRIAELEKRVAELESHRPL